MGLILHNSQEAFVPLERELESLDIYLELESLRFEQKFTYSIKVDPHVDIVIIKVPPLIIQPYVENSIWHGLMHKNEKGHISVDIFQEKDVLICRITDDGIGRKRAAEYKSKFSSRSKSVGMNITADRIASLSKNIPKKDSLMIRDLLYPDGTAAGTEVTLKIPMSL
jgi:LytS/YehU family sensor histidine kinase